MPKKSVRADMLARRKSLNPIVYRDFSRMAQERLLATPEFIASAVVALYRPVANEVATEELHHAAVQSGKRVVYPRISDRHLEFVAVYELSELHPGAFGVPEPTGDVLVNPESIDLILVPGVAFDQRGFRLGYGKGFYDRFLAASGGRAHRVGFCFDFQLVDALPVEGHDVGMQMLITETRTLHIQSEDNEIRF